ncbi:MAG: hypothetical protein AAFV69_00370 [Pseudomonadota bacterium]
MTKDLFGDENTTCYNAAHYMVWGSHPDYATGEWIKVAKGDEPEMISMRKRAGFKLKCLPVGETPASSTNEDDP